MSAPSGEAVLAATWLLIFLAAAMLCARLYHRLRIKRLSFRWSDTFLCLSLSMSVMASSFGIVAYQEGALRPHVSTSLAGYDGTPEQMSNLLMLNFLNNFPFHSAYSFTKFALLAFYLDLFPVFLIKLRLTLWLTVGFCVSAWVVSLGLNLFGCWPISRNWTLDSTQSCSEAYMCRVFYICWGMHLAGEVIIFALPFFMLSHVKLKSEVKVGVYATFTLGILAIAFAITRFLAVHLGEEVSGTSNRFRSLSLIELYNALDVNVGLIVAIMPSLRAYLRLLPFRTHSSSSRSGEERQRVSKDAESASSDSGDGTRRSQSSSEGSTQGLGPSSNGNLARGGNTEFFWAV